METSLFPLLLALKSYNNFQIESPESPETSQSFTLRKPSKSEGESVRLTIRSKEQQIEDSSTEISIKKKRKPSVETVSDVIVSLDKPLESEEAVEESILLQKSESEESETEQTFRIPKKRSESVTFTVEETKKQIDEISADITIKKKLKPKVRYEEESAVIRIGQTAPEVEYEEESASASILISGEESDRRGSKLIARQIVTEEDQFVKLQLKKKSIVSDEIEPIESQFKIRGKSQTKQREFSEVEKSFELQLESKDKKERVRHSEESAIFELTQESRSERSYEVTEDAAQLTIKKEVEFIREEVQV